MIKSPRPRGGKGSGAKTRMHSGGSSSTQQMVVGATDPVHGVPQWAWDLNENGVEGAKLHPPNMEQSDSTARDNGGDKRGTRGTPGGATKDLWDHYGQHMVNMVWDPTIAHPVDLVSVMPGRNGHLASRKSGLQTHLRML